MADPTDLDLQRLILAEIGDENGAVLQVMPTIWAMYQYESPDGGPASHLQYLRAKRKGIDVLLGLNRGAVNYAEGDLKVSLQQKITNLLAMQKSTDQEIAVYVAAAQQPASAQVSSTVLQQAVPGYADPNDARYLGDPLQRQGFRVQP